MKKIFLLLIVLIIASGNLTVLAKPHHGSSHHHHRHWWNYNTSHQEPDYIISQFVTHDTIDTHCNKHYINVETTTISYSQSGTRTYRNYTAFDYNNNLIIDNCYYIQHVTHNNKCYFIIQFIETEHLFGNDKAAILSVDNNFVIQNKYNKLKQAAINRFVVKKDGAYGIIDLDENQIVPIIYNAIKELDCGLYRIKANGNYGIVSYNGEQILPCEYDTIKKRGTSYYQVKKDKKWGILSNNGKIIAPVAYKNVKISKNILYGKDNNNNWVKINDTVNI